MGVIMTARCVKCGRMIDLDDGIPFADGCAVRHQVAFFDDEGLTNIRQCDGRFVSVMGRTDEEIREAIALVRAEPSQ